MSKVLSFIKGPIAKLSKNKAMLVKFALLGLLIGIVFYMINNNFIEQFGQEEAEKKEADKTKKTDSKEEEDSDDDEGPNYKSYEETPFYKDMTAGEDLDQDIVKRLVDKASTLAFYEWKEGKKREKVLIKVIEMVIDSIKQASTEIEAKAMKSKN
tara:strand:+ start:7067 stop:7531 length:465 start_codon:yes stop_codon:yes gene_type:complete